jgi:CheY-like chemotaxis protein
MEKPYVLLVDDNEATVTLVTALLQRDFAIDCASDGAEAIERLKTGNYAAIVLDLRMPTVDGYGVLDFLQASRPEAIANVIILTASLSQREMERVRRYPVCAVVGKPFEIETLLAVVKQCAGPERPYMRGNILSGGMIILLADLLRQRWMM